MPCLREVFLPWQLLFDTHDAVGTIAIGYARDFFLFHFFWYAIRQKMAGFVDSFTLEWNVCVKYLVIPRKNGKKCKECPKFIVRRVNKLISVDPCHSIVLSFIFFLHFCEASLFSTACPECFRCYCLRIKCTFGYQNEFATNYNVINNMCFAYVRLKAFPDTSVSIYCNVDVIHANWPNVERRGQFLLTWKIEKRW